MKKILFAIDDTPECQRAAEYVTDFFGTMSDCSFTLIHIKPEFNLYGDAMLTAYEEAENKEEDKAREVLEKFTQFFTSKGLNPTALIKEGEPVSMVLEEAKNHHLLVIGRSADSFFNKIFSSNQDDFITKTPIPVLLVK
ncbi:hypothetical protein CCZ01_07790 [Helicobacter monodelphidis]|uniref:universal stress protein n=1 Tax=Helicobacter sp. 15-1451 TaxID=2004995 RepID=UPI000DCDA0D4|nr:universal stress protein [Helicobacter sp. 15-1451]RAX56945.1 hypothetical protein CCZ01_07790 [Helicobacter sp. 15-1451]